MPFLNAVAAFGDHVTLFKNDIRDPNQYWDDRHYDLHLKSSECRHNNVKEALWIKNFETSGYLPKTPGWRALFRNACSRSSKKGTRCSNAPGTEAAGKRLHPGNEFSWTAGISQHVKCGRFRQALKTYEEMQECRVKPSSYTFVAILKACSSLQDLGRGKQIHADVVQSGFESVLFVGTMLVDMYAKCGSLVEARDVFEKMPHRDVVSWNCMILGYAQMREGEAAIKLYHRMQQEGIRPDHRTFVSVLKGCNDLTTLEEKKTAHWEVVDNRALEQVRAIHLDIAKTRFESDLFVGTMLVDVYAKCGSLVDARLVFEKMPHHNVVSWTAMIFGYAQMEEGEMALELFARMQEQGLIPNGRTFVGALKACGSVTGLEKGKQIHFQISKFEFEDYADLFLSNALIDMYGRCGSMVDAQQVFDVLPIRDMVTWGALIAGYARSGESNTVFNLLERMEQEGLQPDSIIFLSVLTVCNHGGLVDEGQKYFEAMSRDHAITPSIEHYTCMVDLLGRAGKVETAMELVVTMPCRPDFVVWITVLVACRKWRNVELGWQVFEHALRSNRKDARAYVLMASIYADNNMHEEAEKIQQMRVKTRVWKQSGQSWWANSTGIVHAFVVEDQEHPEKQYIYSNLQLLCGKMEEEGYIAQWKEGYTCRHFCN